MTAIATTDLFTELEYVVKAGSRERRTPILPQVTGLFLRDAGRLNEHRTSVFDGVLVQLTECANSQPLATPAFADMQFVPKRAIRCLASHEDAAVAAPILLRSEARSTAQRTIRFGSARDLATTRGQPCNAVAGGG
jgi:hypothetical protein